MSPSTPHPNTSGRKSLAFALLAGVALTVVPFHDLRASDPYDQSLEQRVEALERELGTLSSDDKGKDVTTAEVPTFLRAAGANVRELTISGDLRFRYNYDNEDFQYPGGGNELQRSRYVFRLRLNLNYTLSDNFFIGLGVSTNGQSTRKIRSSPKASTITASISTSSCWAGRRPTGARS